MVISRFKFRGEEDKEIRKEIESLESQLAEANKKIKELEEYKWMYEDLCK